MALADILTEVERLKAELLRHDGSAKVQMRESKEAAWIAENPGVCYSCKNQGDYCDDCAGGYKSSWVGPVV
jgi:hypothetical protein